MIRSRGLRILAATTAAVALVACAWVLLGNAYAAKREREATQALEKTFGSRSALESKYPPRETNAEARRAEELVKNVGYDLTPKLRGSRNSSGGGGFSEKERAAISDYVTAQLGRADDSVSAPSPEVAALLDRSRAALSTFEEFLESASSPRWSFDPAGSAGEERMPNLLGHLQTQRLLAADALAFAARGDATSATRALEASWNLNGALVVRPEVVSQLMAMAVSRFQVGALRRVSAPPAVWSPRLSAIGGRALLVDALVVEHGAPGDFVRRARADLAREGGGENRFARLFREPTYRVFSAEYWEIWASAIAALRDAPAFEAPKEAPQNPRRPAEIVLAVAMTNLRNSFDRADRLALDAELTGKILKIKELRRARGAWPEQSPEIAFSRFPGLSWSYRPAGTAATIALSRDVPNPSPKNSLVLPLSFTAAP